MSEGQINTPGCRKFEAALMPQISGFLARHSMAKVGDVRYYGPDPKGGYLYLVFFQGERFLMQLRTVDGAAEVLIGPLNASREWTDEGWFWPNSISRMSEYQGPSAGELNLLRDQITELLWL
jgi:hypothetical protein